MSTNRILHISVLFSTAFVFALLGIYLTVTPASAHCTLYHPHHCLEVPSLPGSGGDSSSDSCLAVFTETYYEFRISNDTGITFNYSVNDQSYTLSDGYYQDFKLPKAYGSNSCNTQYYNTPQVNFDSSPDSGYQEKSYNVGGDGARRYVFEPSGSGWDLFIASDTATTSSSHIAYGDTRNGSVNSNNGDRWTFSGKAGEWVRITMTSSTFDTYLKLLDPNNNVVAEDDDGGGGTNSKIYVSSLPTTGTYTIIARGYNGATGGYQLLLE